MKYNLQKIYKISLALSGGVDSAVSAWILKKIGYQVTCVFIKSWEENKNKKCNYIKDLIDAKKICQQLNIKLLKINFSYEYWNKVFTKFIIQQKKGNTLNPDVICNQEIKFKLFLKFSLITLKHDFIATGHYVQKIRKKNFYFLKKNKDKKKDQSYFLYKITQKQLKKCLFPLSNYKKKQVRTIAKNINLVNAKKKDSTGICFIGKKNFYKFIIKYIPKKQGTIIDIDTKKNIGKHKGLFLYTIGQRKYLNLGGGYHIPYFVAKKNIKNNYLYVAQGKNNKKLFSTSCVIKKIHFIVKKTKIKKKKIFVLKIRSQQTECYCYIYSYKKNLLKLKFQKPIFAVTPGQSAVLYKNNICIGGGIIYKAF